MAIGTFGEVTFEISSEKILNFENLVINEEARWATQEVLNGKPQSEFLGETDNKITLSVSLKAVNGVNPEKELAKFKDILSNGKYESLIIGKKVHGKYYIKSYSAKASLIDNLGDIWQYDVDLSLNEYCENISYTTSTVTTKKTVQKKDSKTKKLNYSTGKVS